MREILSAGRPRRLRQRKRQTWSAVPVGDTIQVPSDVARRYRVADRDGVSRLARRAIADMTRQYLAGELSVRLEQLRAASDSYVEAVASLRADAESSPPWALSRVLARAIALADRMCWDSLTAGDVARFRRQAEIAADLRCFGTCARLISDEP